MLSLPALAVLAACIANPATSDLCGNRLVLDLLLQRRGGHGVGRLHRTADRLS
jgi:hypothetical protein